LLRRPKLTLSCSAEGKEGYVTLVRHWECNLLKCCYTRVDEILIEVINLHKLKTFAQVCLPGGVFLEDACINGLELLGRIQAYMMQKYQPQ
jgi:hypothetical protein